MILYREKWDEIENQVELRACELMCYGWSLMGGGRWRASMDYDAGFMSSTNASTPWVTTKRG